MVKYIYVTSHAFSGSTLTSFLLGAHPEIATVGELGIAPGIDPEGFICSCGEQVTHCDFWVRVTRAMNERGLDFDIRRAGMRFRVENDVIADRLLRAGPQSSVLEHARSAAIRMWPKAHGELTRLLHRYECFVAAVLEIRNRGAFLDISKRPGNLIHLSRIPRFDLKVIRLTRDPRAVAHSCMRNLGLTLEDGARSWIRFQKESSAMMRLMPSDSCMTVRYEDLCSDPGATLAKIHGMVGATPSTEIPEFRSVEHHIVGNRMRLQSGSDIRLDEKWRRALDAAQIDAVNRIIKPESFNVGYGTG